MKSLETFNGIAASITVAAIMTLSPIGSSEAVAADGIVLDSGDCIRVCNVYLNQTACLQLSLQMLGPRADLEEIWAACKSATVCTLRFGGGAA